MAFLPGLGGGGPIGGGAIRIGADMSGVRGQVRNGIRDIKGELKRGASDIQRQGSAWDGVFGAVGKAAKVGMFAVAGAVGTGIAAAIEFEKSWAGVRKTVDATPARLEKLRGEFRQLAKEIPISINELAHIGETAGALGVATESITSFTKVVAELGSTTNVSSDQAATALGQLSNVLKLTQGDYEKFGSTLVDLGNKGASTESQILDIASRAGAAGKLLKMSTPDILSWGSAVASLGIETEAGGSALQFFFLQASKVVNQVTKKGAPTARQLAEAHMKVRIATEALSKAESKHGKTSAEAQKASLSLMKAQDALGKLTGGTSAELTSMAKVAGVTVAEFKALFEKDASQALSLFLTGLGKLPAAAQQSELAILHLSNIRVIRALLGLANNSEELNRQLGVGEKAWEANTALATAAGKRYETTAAQLSLLKNTFVDLFISLGDALLPAVKAFVTIIREDAPRAAAFLATVWNQTLGPAAAALLDGVTKLASGIGSVFDFGGGGAGQSGLATAFQGIANGAAAAARAIGAVTGALGELLKNPVINGLAKLLAVVVGLRLVFSGGRALVGTLNRKSGNALGFLSGGRFGTAAGPSGGDPALDASASALTGSAAALEGAAAMLKGSAAAKLAGGLGPNAAGAAGLIASDPAGSRRLGGHLFGQNGQLLAVGTGPVDRMAYMQNKRVWDAYGKSAVRQTVASMAQGVVTAGRTIKTVAGSAFGMVSRLFWPAMIADLAIEFIKAPLGDFIASSTEFKRAGALIREDFFGGLGALVKSWAIGSDAWVGRAETMQIGSGKFKTITLAKLGITSATFDKLEAPVGTITHAEGQAEASQKLATGLGQQAGESIRQWWNRVQDKLPEQVKQGAAKFFDTSSGRGASLKDEKGLSTYLANATVNQIADISTAVKTDYVTALTELLTGRGYTIGQIGGLSTDQLANIGNMAATDTDGKFTGLENFLLDSYLGKLGQKREAAGKKGARRTKGDIVGSTGDLIADVAGVEKRSEAAIKNFYKTIPQNFQDALNAFINQSSAISPSILAGLKKKFGDDWITAFRDGTTAITDKPVDKKVVAEMVRVFGPHWREALQEAGGLLFQREGGADTAALKKSLAAALSAEIAKLTPAELGDKPGKPGATQVKKDRAAIQAYISSAIGQAALANATSPDVTTAKKGMADLGEGLKKAIPDESARSRFVGAMVALQKAATIPNLDVVTNLLNSVPAADRGLGLVGDALDSLAERAHAFLVRVGATPSGGSTGSGARKATRSTGTQAASGLVGTTTGPTRILAGEAGREHIAIIRNFRELAVPRVGSLASAGFGGPRVAITADKLQLFSDGDRRSLDAQLGFLAPDGR